MTASENIRTIKIYVLYHDIYLCFWVIYLTIRIICAHIAPTHFSVPCFDEFSKHFQRFCRLNINRKRSFGPKETRLFVPNS